MNDLSLNTSILIVDDDPSVAKSLCRLLRRSGFDVTVAFDGNEAISLLKTFCPSIIISDYRMPDISGVEVLRRAREMCPKTVRILISGYSEEDAFDFAVEEDPPFLFFSKPWNDARLVSEIRKRITPEKRQEK